MKNKLPYLMPLLALILISLLVHWRWFSNLSPLTYGDWYYMRLPQLKEFFNLPLLWVTGAASFGNSDVALSLYPPNLLFGALARLGLGFEVGERLIFMLPLVLFMPLGSYLMLNRFFKNTMAAFTGSIVYTYNTFFLIRNQEQLFITVAFALVPFLLLLLDKILTDKKTLPVLMLGLVLTLQSFYEFRIFYITFFILVFYAIFFAVRERAFKNGKEFLQLGIRVAIPFVMVCVANLYWILPLAGLDLITGNSLFNRDIFGASWYNMSKSMTLFHPFWTGGETAPFIVQSLPWFAFFIPAAAFTGLFLNRKNSLVVFFGGLALLGIFLTKQAADPFPGAYQWLFHHWPGFNAFRESSKFSVITVLGYSVLIGSLVAALGKKTHGRQNYWFVTAVAGICLLFLLNTVPFITGAVKTIYVPRTIPTDYNIVSDFLLRQTNYSRVLWLPYVPRYSLQTFNHPRVGPDMFTTDWRRYVKQPPDVTFSLEHIKDVLGMPAGQGILAGSGIKYVMLALGNDDFNLNNFKVDNRLLLRYVESLPYLKEVPLGTSSVRIFEVSGVLPHIYMTHAPLSSFDPIRYRMANPTRYNLTVPAISVPAVLTFSDNYDLGWQLAVTADGRNYDLPASIHKRNSLGFNEFIINPRTINNLVPNQTKDKELRLALYFKPQRYVDTGLAAGGALFIGLVILLLYLSLREKHDKK